MSVTVSIGNSWYVLDNIIGMVGAHGDQPAKMLMSTGHVLEMTDVSEEVVQHIRNLRDPRPAPAEALRHGTADCDYNALAPKQQEASQPALDMEMIDEAATAG